MTEIIDLNSRRARPVPDLTKHDSDPTRDAPRVLEGVVIPSGVPGRAKSAAARAALAGAGLRRAAGVTRHVVTHDRTKTGARLVARHGSYVVGGAGVLAKRTWDGRSAARYERMMRIAEAAGNSEEAKEWEERGRQFRAARHQRRMDLLTMPQRVAKALVVGAATATGGLLGLGVLLAIAEKHPGLVLAPIMGTIDAVRWAVVLVTIVWGPALWLAPCGAFLGLWNTGRLRGAAPQWALPARERSDGAPITPSIVVTAVRDLGIAPLRASIKAMEDNGAGMLSPIVLAGCGVEVDITLPSGSSTEEVLARRRKLAENLGRHEHEVHLSVAPAARTVRAWIADSGALDEPIGPSPLVLDADISADYAKGRAPWGVDLRGDAALISLYQRHMLITGLSNQGKTASLRALALWLGHDPAVIFRIGDLKGIGDWRMFTGIAEVLIEGPTDEHVIDVTEMVEGGVEEMNRRLLAPGGSTFPPLVFIVDEAQVAYGSAARDTYVTDNGTVRYGAPYGGSKATSRYFQAVKKIHDQGRAVNVTIWEGTQDPTNENLPKRSREGNHIRASLVLGTESQARMALGDNPIDAGAAPHKLRQGLDKGVVVVAGDGIKLAPGQPSVTVRTHYIDEDQAKELAARIKARRAGVDTRTTADTGDMERVDHLADIATVLGEAKRLRTDEVRHRLAALNPAAYAHWTAQDLTAVLTDAGAAPYKSGGVMVVSADAVRDAIARRDTDADTAEDDAE
ncbi:DNA segregation ATPase FtsK/SpoIIIE, S-DNA-T family [Actinacidiphila yanglinensis]|uniref:DNA segregation ATPase FtsK/SpoIIIE, S-DNA-T family n=1 Tax=Actinacidiphila yanglinensis TaxID=310779 RepID=A0A1H6ABI3_9ACTN|nr:ATP-binding protein [Actinacidiphila yanglinensis]SEG46119.1 DNA segregation ATPase FtsK/SpoIIIE, S-DNA-T family [Actinacidiphila yanglinensis]